MATLLEGVTLAIDGTFQQRVAMACYYVAREVLFEAESVPNHAIRARYAQQVIKTDVKLFYQFAALLITDPAIVSKLGVLSNTITDGEIIDGVRRMWNPLAGAV